MTVTASAPAKTILFGEHAVVYGEPAIAIPLLDTRTFVTFRPNGHEFRVVSPKIGMDRTFSEMDRDSGLFRLIQILTEKTGITELPDDTMEISGDIPIASGLGSGAALSAAVIRAFAKRFNWDPDNETVNSIAFEIEKIYHGTPSGIDNTVIVYERPLLFQKGHEPSLLKADISRLPLLVVDSGIRSRTIDVVSDVRANFEQNEKSIREIGALVREAVIPLENGDLAEIGSLMNRNQELLRVIDVSCPELDELIGIANRYGAAGAKLTGAGRGGNFIVLARDEAHAEELRSIYKERGVNVIL